MWGSGQGNGHLNGPELCDRLLCELLVLAEVICGGGGQGGWGGDVGREVAGEQGNTRRVEELGLTHTETRRDVEWTTRTCRRVGSENRKTTPATPSTTPGAPTTGPHERGNGTHFIVPNLHRKCEMMGI